MEIGAETGSMTRRLLQRAEASGGTLTTVEPLPSQELVEMDRSREAFRLVEGASPGALEDVGAADVWIIDGDHNYWTVRAEVDRALTLSEQEGRPTLLVLHDVGWPCARRDFYYAPDRLPPAAVHPHTWTRGVVPGDPGTASSGLRGVGNFAVALSEGGERNGVLTAIEDAIADREGIECRTVPVVYGVAFVWTSGAAWSDAVSAVLEPYADSPLLRRLEENRIALYLRVLELQDALTRSGTADGRLLAASEERAAALANENAGLHLALARARAVA